MQTIPLNTMKRIFADMAENLEIDACNDTDPMFAMIHQLRGIDWDWYMNPETQIQIEQDAMPVKPEFSLADEDIRDRADKMIAAYRKKYVLQSDDKSAHAVRQCILNTWLHQYSYGLPLEKMAAYVAIECSYSTEEKVKAELSRMVRNGFLRSDAKGGKRTWELNYGDDFEKSLYPELSEPGES